MPRLVVVEVNSIFYSDEQFVERAVVGPLPLGYLPSAPAFLGMAGPVVPAWVAFFVRGTFAIGSTSGRFSSGCDGPET